MLSYVFTILIWRRIAQLYTCKYSLIKAQLQLENDDPNIYIKDKKELKYFAITIIVFFSDYHEWVNSYKNRESYHTYSKLYKGDSDIWCCRSESE